MDGDERTETAGHGAASHDDAGRLLIWTLRRLVLRPEQPCAALAGALAESGGGGCDPLATLRIFVDVLRRTARGRIEVGRPGWPQMTADERRLVLLVAAAQHDDRPRLDALLSWFARHEARHELAIVAHALAAALAARNLRLPRRLPDVPCPLGPGDCGVGA